LNWLKCTDDTNLFLEGVQMLVLQPWQSVHAAR
jgi:hypothetical protein